MESDINSNNDEQKKLPSIDSSDPNERKLARRMRIEARLEAARKEQEEEGSDEEKEPHLPLIVNAIEDSEDTLRRLYYEGKELVTNVMVASDAKEVARREIEEEERNNRLEQLKEDSALALKKLDEISCKWESIMELNGPLELFEHMKEQKLKCLELIEQKNELIKNFQMELKLADEKFMKGRKAMYEELALLTKRIDEQVLLMKRAYRVELNKIEDSIDVTRTELMNKHQKTWLSLYNQREKQEILNMGRKFKLVEKFHEELHDLHVEHDEKYREMRINLETDIQILEQELEQVKALCLLNSEKLDYNYQVLKKREEENLYIKNHQKRRLNKLQDMVNTLKKKIDEKRQSTDEEYKKLANDVKRYHKNILETEKKAEHFSQANDEKFDSIWEMKDEEAKDLLEKIHSADMIIHQQILGLDWSPPCNLNFSKKDYLAYKTAENFVNSFGKIKKSRQNQNSSASGSKPSPDTQQNQELVAGQKRLLSQIFELLADQSGFLMEEKLDELLMPYTEEEKTFVRLDNVFTAIGIKTDSDLDIMTKVFMPYSVCFYCEKERASSISFEFRHGKTSRQQSVLHIHELEEKVSKLRVQAKGNINEVDSVKMEIISNKSQASGKDSEVRRRSTGVRRGTVVGGDGQGAKCDMSHPLMIEKIYVLRALRDFVSVYHADRIREMVGIEEKLTNGRITISRMLSKDDITCYWEKYREAIPPRLGNVWAAVYEGLKRYLEILKSRHELNVKAKALRRQNLDLKKLLSHYKIPEGCNTLRLPKVLSVPNEPISFNEIMTLSQKLYL